MLAALISLPSPGDDDQPIIAGKTIACRQLLFAQELGCESVIAYGNGASSDAIMLRHFAENANMRFQTVFSSQSLAGIIGSGDRLLVMQTGLLPEDQQPLDLLKTEGDRMLTVSSAPGVAAGFERIDLDRSWAGALTMPGSWLEHLSSLPDDIAPQSAILRICLQKRLSEARISDETLNTFGWTIIRNDKAATDLELGWIRKHLEKVEGTSPTHWLAGQIVQRGRTCLLNSRFSLFGLGLAGILALVSALLAVVYVIPWLSFLLIAVSAPLFETFLSLTRVTSAPFGNTKKLRLVRSLVDGTLLISAILAIDGFWYRAAFPSVMFVALLLLLDRRRLAKGMQIFRDRGVLALALSIGSAVILPEIAIMIVATVCLVALLLNELRKSE